MKRIRVPADMLSAGSQALCDYSRQGRQLQPWYEDVSNISRVILEAALLWLSEHPQVPTDEQIGDMLRDLRRAVSGWDETSTYYRSRDLCVEWQRRCFVQEEPEIHAEIKDLLFDETDRRSLVGVSVADEHIQEAYRRGLSAGLGLEVDTQGRQKGYLR